MVQVVFAAYVKLRTCFLTNFGDFRFMPNLKPISFAFKGLADVRADKHKIPFEFHAGQECIILGRVPELLHKKSSISIFCNNGHGQSFAFCLGQVTRISHRIYVQIFIILSLVVYKQSGKNPICFTFEKRGVLILTLYCWR